MTDQQDYHDWLLIARQQARLADDLYRGKGAVVLRSHQVGAEAIYWEDSFWRAAALVFEDHIHLAICGTNDWFDWLQNVHACQVVNALGMRVHRGFEQTARTIARAIRHRSLFWDALKHLPLYFGGHSAGGAIALLMSAAQRFIPKRLFTWGGPRAIHPDAVASYLALPFEISAFRLRDDPFPSLPFKRFFWLFNGARYAHPSLPMQILPDGTMTTERPSGMACKVGWATGMAVRSSWDLLRLRAPRFVRDHKMWHYRQAIEAACVKEGLFG